MRHVRTELVDRMTTGEFLLREGLVHMNCKHVLALNFAATGQAAPGPHESESRFFAPGHRGGDDMKSDCCKRV